MKGGEQGSLAGRSPGIERCFISHRPAVAPLLGVGNPSRVLLYPSVTRQRMQRSGERRAQNRSVLHCQGGYLSLLVWMELFQEERAAGKSSPGCLEYYGPKWERLLI